MIQMLVIGGGLGLSVFAILTAIGDKAEMVVDVLWSDHRGE